MANELMKPQAQATGFSLIPRNMDEAFKIADMMVRSKSLPDHLRTPGDALMIVEQAGRWEMSPFAVAQCSFSYKGKLGYEGKLIQAVIEGSPMARRIIASLMDYQFSGEGENRTITASALRVGEDKPRTVTVSLKEARTANEWWKKTPDQMLCYHAVRVWSRRWAPSLILGVYSADELYQGADREESQGIVIEGEVDTPPATERHARGTSELREEINRDIPIEPVNTAPPPQKRTVREIVRDKLAACFSADDVANVADDPLVAKALREAPDNIKMELNNMLGEVYARFATVNDDGGSADEPASM